MNIDGNFDKNILEVIYRKAVYCEHGNSKRLQQI